MSERRKGESVYCIEKGRVEGGRCECRSERVEGGVERGCMLRRGGEWDGGGREEGVVI